MTLNKQNFLTLPFLFDSVKLKNSLLSVQDSDWVSHPNTQAYDGEWMATSLRSTNGSTREIVAVENQTYINTPLLDSLPYIQTIINNFQTNVEAVRFMKLGAQSTIKEHRDIGSNYEEGLARIHIPISSNNKVKFTVAGKVFQMDSGKCYYINADQPHSVVNHSNEARVHLLIDCHVNSWLKKIFEEHGFKAKVHKYGSKGIDDSNINAIIENLRAINTETSLKMAEDLIQKKANNVS